MFASVGSEVVGAPPLETQVAKNAKMGQTNVCNSTAHRSEVSLSLSHSQMLKNRRSKQTTKKRLAGAAKRAKKLRKQNVKVVSADAPKKGPP